MYKKNVIFDFDGTIADTLDAAVNIYNAIAPKYHCKPVKMEDKDILRGKRPQDFFKDYGVTSFKLPFLLIHIRGELKKHIINTPLVKDISIALKDLKDAGYNLGILTSNSKENVDMFLFANKLTEIFDFIYSSKNVFGKDKDILHLLKNRNIKKDNVVYVGDETRDIEAAKRVGIPIIAVSWGFNTREILVAQGPSYIIDEPGELLNCLSRF